MRRRLPSESKQFYLTRFAYVYYVRPLFCVVVPYIME